MTTAAPARVAVVEDHVLQRVYTENLIESQPDLALVHSCDTLPELVDWLPTEVGERPQLILLDLMADRQPNADPADVRRLIAEGVRVLVLSAMTSTPLVRRMVEVGVSGLLGKRDTEQDVLTAIRAVLAGTEVRMSPDLAAVIAQDPERPSLTEVEERTLVLYSSGLTLDEVAGSLGVDTDAVRTHLRDVSLAYTAIA